MIPFMSGRKLLMFAMVRGIMSGLLLLIASLCYSFIIVIVGGDNICTHGRQNLLKNDPG